jgi:hypothetical protein
VSNYLFAFVNYRDSVKVLIQSDAKVPQIRSVETVVEEVQNLLGVQPLVIGDWFENGDQRGIGVFIHRKHAKHLDQLDGYELAHPRRLELISRRTNLGTLFDLSLDWLSDHKFAASFLAKNLERLR